MSRKLSMTMAAILLIGILLTGCQPAVSPSAAAESPQASATPDSTVSATATATAQPTDAAAAPKKLDYAKFTVYNGDATDTTQVDPMKTEIWSKLFELTNTDLQVEFLVGQDGDQKAGVMIASGEIPDILIPNNSWRQFYDAGLFLDIKPYLDKDAPNLKAWIGEEGLKLSTDAEGKFYSVTRQMPPDPNASFKSLYPASGAFYICNGALKDANYPVVKTWDEYVKLISDYVAKHPTTNGAPTIGFSGPAEGWRFTFAKRGAFSIHGRGDDLCMYDKETGKVTEFYGDTIRSWYKDYLKKLYDLNQAHLLDPEFVSQTYDQYVAKLSAGRVVAYFDEWWESALPASSNLRANKLVDSYPVPMPVLAPDAKQDYGNGVITVDYWPTACISTKCANPERAVQFFDALANEKVAKLINWGVEGTHYVVKDGNNALTDEQYQATQNPDYNTKTGIRCSTLTALLPKTYPQHAKYSDGTDWDYFRSQTYFSRAYDDTEKSILAKYGWNDFSSGAFASPSVAYSVTVTDPQPVTDFWNNWYGPGSPDVYYQKMIFAKNDAEFEKLWTEWIAKLDAMDTKTIVDHYDGVQEKLVAQYGKEAIRP